MKLTQLTQRQEAYVRGLVSGLSQRRAYRAAYDCPRASDSTVDPKACRLFARADVRARYDALVTEAAREAQWDRLRAARELLGVLETAMDKIRESSGLEVHYAANGRRQVADLPHAATEAALSAIDGLNKLFHIYDEGDGATGEPVIVDAWEKP